MSGAKQTAIDHLNKDHKLALYDYVNAFKGAKLNYFNDSKTLLVLTDITLEDMLLEWSEDGVVRTANIPFEPPLKNFGELRARSVEMAYKAADKLGVSPYQYKEYKHWQNPIDAIVDLTIMGMVLHYVSGVQLASYYDSAFLRLLDQWEWALANGAIICHLVELLFITIPLLRKYRVPAPAYYKWCVATTIGGFFAITRLKKQLAPLDAKRKQPVK